MAIKAGVWIDHKQAVVVLITDAGQAIKKIASGIESHGKSKHKYTSNDFVAEDRLQGRLVNARKKYFDEVLACIRGAASLLILGPGEAKGEFRKHILAKKFRSVTGEVETIDKMTDRQLLAKVSGHFSKAASKPVVRKKTAKAVSGKRTTKTVK